jgi:predicted HNH restriction endonuclease
MALLDGRVPYLKNGVHWLKGRPSSDHPTWKGGITPERQSFYSSREWKTACVAVWKRADAKCERCKKDHRILGNRGTFHVHHIVSFRVKRLRSKVSNLAILCAACHRFVHSKKNKKKEFLKG